MDRSRRVYHGTVQGPDEVIELGPGEAHHIARVLRLRPGDPVSAFDGKGREWDAVVTDVRREGVSIRIGVERTNPVEPDVRVVLYQALCRSERMDWVVQKGTEVGLAEIRPMTTARVEARTPSSARLDRWRRVALEAAKQSGRRVVPVVTEPAGLPQAPPGDGLGIVLHPAAGVPPLAACLPRTAASPIWLVVGPEGGFEDAEIDLLVSRGFRSARLGPRTLRTETAGLVAASIVLYGAADLGSGPEG